MLLAYRLALASPRITAAAVEATEFPQLADRHGVLAVPKVIVDDRPLFEGALPERIFVARVLDAAR